MKATRVKITITTSTHPVGLLSSIKSSTRANSIYDAYAWYYYYTIAGNANTILANIDNAEGTEAERDFVKASALTFRAYAFENWYTIIAGAGKIPTMVLRRG